MESILWFLIVGVVFFVMMRHGCGGHSGGRGGHGGGGCHGGHGGQGGHSGHEGHEGHEAVREGSAVTDGHVTVKDPVCDMEIAPGQAFSMVRKGGRQHYFCSEACAEKFNADPDRYA